MLPHGQYPNWQFLPAKSCHNYYSVVFLSLIVVYVCSATGFQPHFLQPYLVHLFTFQSNVFNLLKILKYHDHFVQISTGMCFRKTIKNYENIFQFNLQCKSIFRAICTLQRLLLSESSIYKTRHKDGWEKLCGLWKYYKICLLKMWCICLQ